MNHLPFIIAAYSVAAVLLTWCALGPVLQGRRLRARLRQSYQQSERSHAPDA